MQPGLWIKHCFKYIFFGGYQYLTILNKKPSRWPYVSTAHASRSCSEIVPSVTRYNMLVLFILTAAIGFKQLV